ncbi:hypothetical protein [Telmatospirillum sp. J64-1]|uniref:hypothetical protein n=1 Tax=Telmatospirillum sp. J64-1 TaxID=2502183 RepID=UPI00115D8097|nr:hypothetical protein [Telmatospirillum sp. J64-1]
MQKSKEHLEEHQANQSSADSVGSMHGTPPEQLQDSQDNNGNRESAHKCAGGCEPSNKGFKAFQRWLLDVPCRILITHLRQPSFFASVVTLAIVAYLLGIVNTIGFVISYGGVLLALGYTFTFDAIVRKILRVFNPRGNPSQDPQTGPMCLEFCEEFRLPLSSSRFIFVVVAVALHLSPSSPAVPVLVAAAALVSAAADLAATHASLKLRRGVV